MLRATNVPWRDLIKSIAYGVTVIQGGDIKWPLVRHVIVDISLNNSPFFYAKTEVDLLIYFRYPCIKAVWLLTQTNIFNMITHLTLSSSSPLPRTWTMTSLSTSRILPDQAQGWSRPKPRPSLDLTFALVKSMDTRKLRNTCSASVWPRESTFYPP